MYTQPKVMPLPHTLQCRESVLFIQFIPLVVEAFLPFGDFSYLCLFYSPTILQEQHNWILLHLIFHQCSFRCIKDCYILQRNQPDYLYSNITCLRYFICHTFVWENASCQHKKKCPCSCGTLVQSLVVPWCLHYHIFCQ